MEKEVKIDYWDLFKRVGSGNGIRKTKPVPEIDPEKVLSEFEQDIPEHFRNSPFLRRYWKRRIMAKHKAAHKIAKEPVTEFIARIRSPRQEIQIIQVDNKYKINRIKL